MRAGYKKSAHLDILIHMIFYLTLTAQGGEIILNQLKKMMELSIYFQIKKI